MALVETAPGGAQRAFVAKRDERIEQVFVEDEIESGHVYTEEQMWANYEYFMRAVLPVAAEAGVRLALHPDDPPVETLGGVARLFRNVEGFRRAEQIAEASGAGEAWGVDLCLRCRSEVAGRP